MLTLYHEFVVKAAAGRKMETERIEALAQGRVYSGLGALNTGLIDSLGGLPSAINTARSLAGIPAKKRVIYDEYPKPKFIDNLRARISASAAYGADFPAFAIPAAFTFPGIMSETGAVERIQDIQYRISRNGQALAMLPLSFPG
jgi:ClpP class serine protease